MFSTVFILICFISASKAISPKRYSSKWCRPLLNLRGREGYIFSPRYPLGYRGNSTCQWHITVNKGMRIRLEIEEFSTFYTDFVFVYDGGDDVSSGLLAAMNKRTSYDHHLPCSFTTSTNEALIRFDVKSYPYINTDGYKFKMRYSQTKEPRRDDPCTSVAVFGEPRGEVKSVGLSHFLPYPINQDLRYRIVAPPKHHILLTRVVFDLEEYVAYPECTDSRWGDYLRLYDGYNTSSTLVGTYCGKNFPESIVSKGNAFFIVFHSDQGVTRQGFQLKFKRV